MAKKMKRSCSDVSPRKKMAMEGTMGADRPRKFQMGGMVDNISPQQAMRVGRKMAEQMAAQMQPQRMVRKFRTM